MTLFSDPETGDTLPASVTVTYQRQIMVQVLTGSGVVEYPWTKGEIQMYNLGAWYPENNPLHAWPDPDFTYTNTVNVYSPLAPQIPLPIVPEYDTKKIELIPGYESTVVEHLP
jgi:hypothetical protein